MRNFQQLTEEKKRAIYAAILTEEPKLRIAQRLGVNNSTVHYYVRKAQNLPRTEVIALTAPKCPSLCETGHTAFQCLVCRKSFDNIKSDEFQQIMILRKRIESLERALKSRNEVLLDHSDSRPASPIVRVAG